MYIFLQNNNFGHLGMRSLQKGIGPQGKVRVRASLSFNFFILALWSGHCLLYWLGLGPVLVYCSDCTPAVDSGPVTLYLMQ